MVIVVYIVWRNVITKLLYILLNSTVYNSCNQQVYFFLVFSKGQLSGGDGVSYDFNMASLADHLKKQSEQGASTYYNIDIIKYEVWTDTYLLNCFMCSGCKTELSH